MTKLEALRRYFNSLERPLTNPELIKLRKEDSKGFDELCELAAKALGEPITQS